MTCTELLSAAVSGWCPWRQLREVDRQSDLVSDSINQQLIRQSHSFDYICCSWGTLFSKTFKTRERGGGGGEHLCFMWRLYLSFSLFAWKHSKLPAPRPKIYDHLSPSLSARTRTDGYVTLFTFNNHLLRPYFWVICHPFSSAAICWMLPEEKGGFCGKWERYPSVSPSVNREKPLVKPCQPDP